MLFCWKSLRLFLLLFLSVSGKSQAQTKNKDVESEMKRTVDSTTKEAPVSQQPISPITDSGNPVLTYLMLKRKSIPGHLQVFWDIKIDDKLSNDMNFILSYQYTRIGDCEIIDPSHREVHTYTLKLQVLSYEIRGLTAWHTVEVTISVQQQRQSQIKEIIDSMVKSALTQDEAPTGMVENIKTDFIGSTMAELSWQPPPCKQRGGVRKGYDVKLTSLLNSVEIKTVRTVSEKVEFDYLEPFSKYQVKIRYVNTESPGPFSDAFDFWTSQAVPSAPNFYNYTYDDINIGLLIFQPVKPNGKILQYQLQMSGGGLGQISLYTQHNGSHYIIEGLIPNTTYVIKMRAKNEAGWGAWSPVHLITTGFETDISSTFLRQTMANGTCIGFMWGRPSQRTGWVYQYRVEVSSSTGEVNGSTPMVHFYNNQTYHCIQCGLQPFKTTDTTIVVEVFPVIFDKGPISFYEVRLLYLGPKPLGNNTQPRIIGEGEVLANDGKKADGRRVVPANQPSLKPINKRSIRVPQETVIFQPYFEWPKRKSEKKFKRKHGKVSGIVMLPLVMNEAPKIFSVPFGIDCKSDKHLLHLFYEWKINIIDRWIGIVLRKKNFYIGRRVNIKSSRMKREQNYDVVNDKPNKQIDFGKREVPNNSLGTFKRLNVVKGISPSNEIKKTEMFTTEKVGSLDMEERGKSSLENVVKERKQENVEVDRIECVKMRKGEKQMERAPGLELWRKEKRRRRRQLRRHLMQKRTERSSANGGLPGVLWLELPPSNVSIPTVLVVKDVEPASEYVVIFVVKSIIVDITRHSFSVSTTTAITKEESSEDWPSELFLALVISLPLLFLLFCCLGFFIVRKVIKNRFAKEGKTNKATDADDEVNASNNDRELSGDQGDFEDDGDNDSVIAYDGGDYGRRRNAQVENFFNRTDNLDQSRFISETNNNSVDDGIGVNTNCNIHTGKNNDDSIHGTPRISPEMSRRVINIDVTGCHHCDCSSDKSSGGHDNHCNDTNISSCNSNYLGSDNIDGIVTLGTNEEKCISNNLETGGIVTLGTNEEKCISNNLETGGIVTLGTNEEKCISNNLETGGIVTLGTNEEKCISNNLETGGIVTLGTNEEKCISNNLGTGEIVPLGTNEEKCISNNLETGEIIPLNTNEDKPVRNNLETGGIDGIITLSHTKEKSRISLVDPLKNSCAGVDNSQSVLTGTSRCSQCNLVPCLNGLVCDDANSDEEMSSVGGDHFTGSYCDGSVPENDKNVGDEDNCFNEDSYDYNNCNNDYDEESMEDLGFDEVVVGCDEVVDNDDSCNEFVDDNIHPESDSDDDEKCSECDEGDDEVDHNNYNEEDEVGSGGDDEYNANCNNNNCSYDYNGSNDYFDESENDDKGEDDQEMASDDEEDDENDPENYQINDGNDFDDCDDSSSDDDDDGDDDGDDDDDDDGVDDDDETENDSDHNEGEEDESTDHGHKKRHSTFSVHYADSVNPRKCKGESLPSQETNSSNNRTNKNKGNSQDATTSTTQGNQLEENDKEFEMEPEKSGTGHQNKFQRWFRNRIRFRGSWRQMKNLFGVRYENQNEVEESKSENEMELKGKKKKKKNRNEKPKSRNKEIENENESLKGKKVEPNGKYMELKMEDEETRSECVDLDDEEERKDGVTKKKSEKPKCTDGRFMWWRKKKVKFSLDKGDYDKENGDDDDEKGNEDEIHEKSDDVDDDDNDKYDNEYHNKCNGDVSQLAIGKQLPYDKKSKFNTNVKDAHVCCSELDSKRSRKDFHACKRQRKARKHTLNGWNSNQKKINNVSLRGKDCREREQKNNCHQEYENGSFLDDSREVNLDRKRTFSSGKKTEKREPKNECNQGYENGSFSDSPRELYLDKKRENDIGSGKKPEERKLNWLHKYGNGCFSDSSMWKADSKKKNKIKKKVSEMSVKDRDDAQCWKRHGSRWSFDEKTRPCNKTPSKRPSKVRRRKIVKQNSVVRKNKSNCAHYYNTGDEKDLNKLVKSDSGSTFWGRWWKKGKPKCRKGAKSKSFEDWSVSSDDLMNFHNKSYDCWESSGILSFSNGADVNNNKGSKRVGGRRSNGGQSQRNRTLTFADEYRALERYRRRLMDTLTFDTAQDNADKNRYKGVFPPDHTLAGLGNMPDDYYNASIVRMMGGDSSRTSWDSRGSSDCSFGSDFSYIAAQSPFKPQMVEDFWKMVIFNRVETIVMICNSLDMDRKMVLAYWLDTGVFAGGPVMVRVTKKEDFGDFVIRTMEVTSSSNVKDLTLTHFQFVTWPPGTEPFDPIAVLDFRYHVRLWHHNKESPMLVHCESGSGRTGVFIAVDALIEGYSSHGQMNVFKTIKRMRSCRPSFIRTFEQYCFVYQCILEEFHVGDVYLTWSDLGSKIDRLMSLNNLTGSSFMRDQFNLMCSHTLRLLPIQCKEGLKTENRSRNRDGHILPPDIFLPVLNSNDPVSPSTYINAVFINGARRLKEFIITQHPLPSTVLDFWRMVYKYKVQTIITLGEYDPKNTPEYWPASGMRQFHYFMVEFMDNSNEGGITVRNLKLQNLIDDKVNKRIVRQFHLKHWALGPPQASAAVVPSTASDDCSMDPTKDLSNGTLRDQVVHLLEMVWDWQTVANMRTIPILVHDSDGSNHCGVFCACAVVCEKFKLDGGVDLYHSVKHIKARRPSILNSFDQYRFIHQVLTEYARVNNLSQSPSQDEIVTVDKDSPASQPSQVSNDNRAPCQEEEVDPKGPSKDKECQCECGGHDEIDEFVDELFLEIFECTESVSSSIEDCRSQSHKSIHCQNQPAVRCDRAERRKVNNSYVTEISMSPQSCHERVTRKPVCTRSRASIKTDRYCCEKKGKKREMDTDDEMDDEDDFDDYDDDDDDYRRNVSRKKDRERISKYPKPEKLSFRPYRCTRNYRPRTGTSSKFSSQDVTGAKRCEKMRIPPSAKSQTYKTKGRGAETNYRDKMCEVLGATRRSEYAMDGEEGEKEETPSSSSTSTNDYHISVRLL